MITHKHFNVKYLVSEVMLPHSTLDHGKVLITFSIVLEPAVQ